MVVKTDSSHNVLLILLNNIRIVCYIHIYTCMQHARVHLLDTESFGATFGPKSQRKRPHIPAADIEVNLL